MLTIEDLRASTIGIIGFGKEGLATARFLAAHGLTATVFDVQGVDELGSQTIREWEQKGFSFVCGKPFTDFTTCTVLFRSPGVPRLHPAIMDAEAHGVIITSQTKWFFDYCPAPIIGVTGTKGKGTTVSLIAQVLECAKSREAQMDVLGDGGNIYVTGNIGKDDPFDLLGRVSSSDVVVFELSSFQLQDLTVSPHIGVCLMVTQEHLDHHGNIAEYHAAKAAIIAHQKSGDIAVYAADYPASVEIGQQGHGQKYEFSRAHAVTTGVYTEDGKVVHIEGLPISGSFNVEGRVLRGAHNLENICAAAAVGAAVGVPIELLAEAITSFKGLEHRLEYIGEFGKLQFYNDSISTIPESAIAAVEAFNTPTVLILGGSEKNSDFTELAACLAKSSTIRGLIVVGVTAPRIIAALQQAGYTGPLKEGAENMEHIFQQIAELAQPGDVVLLSPACASFGMFANYKDRGDQFKAYARKYQSL